MGQTLNLIEDVALARGGNSKAFTRLIEQTQNTVTSIALAIVKDIDNSEEVAQMVFISTWQNFQQLKNNASFLPWLRQMTRYTAYNFLRDNKVDRKIAGEKAEQLLADFCHPQLSQDESLSKQQQSHLLNDFISELPDDSREIILLYYREEQSTKQVANLLELSEQNVRKKLSRVRGLLKQQILERYGQLILSTMPAIGFSSLVVSSMAVSPSVAASTTSSFITSKSGFLGKFPVLLNGVLWGLLSAVAAVIFGAKYPIQKVTNQQAKKQLINYRNQTIIWLVFSGVLLILSYENTRGWITPVTVYTLMILGLIKQTRLISLYAEKHMKYDKNNNVKLTQKQSGKFWGVLGMVLGCVVGYLALIVGLINNGRM